MTDQSDAICAAYMARLDAALSGLPPGDREQILEQISEHIASARAALSEQTDAGVLEILERLGQPEEIAAAAKSETGTTRRRQRSPVLFFMTLAVVLVALGIGISAAAGAFSSGVVPASTSNGSRVPRTPAPQAAPGLGVSVPQVAGEQLARAVQSLNVANLGYKVSYVSGNQPVGTVVVQQPSAGTVIQDRSNVSLVVVGTASSVTVPNVVGQSQAQAEASLASLGLDMTVVGPVTNGQVPTGVVISQSPAAGSDAQPRASIAVTVSAGPG